MHVVIIGFAREFLGTKRIYELQGDNTVAVDVTNINPYLLEGTNTVLRTAVKPLNGAPPISYGSMMIDKDRRAGDDEGLILTAARRLELLNETPALAPFVRCLFGGDEFLNSVERWCLWLIDAPPGLIRSSKLLTARLDAVRKFRLSSSRPQTCALAATPSLFGEIRQPTTPYLIIPKVSSEKRTYIPIGFLSPENIASGSALVVPDATRYHFGVLTSAMHNAWMRCVAGRMKSDYQYSNNIVYNNFPWPNITCPTNSKYKPEWPLHVRESSEEFLMTQHDDYGYKFGVSKQSKKSVRGLTADDKKRMIVEVKAQVVLDARAKHSLSTLADLYDPLTMPPDLVKAHAELDRAVDQCYRSAPFTSDRQRVEFLFALYEQYTSPLLPMEKKTKRLRK